MCMYIYIYIFSHIYLQMVDFVLICVCWWLLIINNNTDVCDRRRRGWQRSEQREPRPERSEWRSWRSNRKRYGGFYSEINTHHTLSPDWSTGLSRLHDWLFTFHTGKLRSHMMLLFYLNRSLVCVCGTKALIGPLNLMSSRWVHLRGQRSGWECECASIISGSVRWLGGVWVVLVLSSLWWVTSLLISIRQLMLLIDVLEYDVTS